MSRFWPDGLEISVAADAEATPLQIRWGRQTHAVAQIRERWRVDQGWWQRRVWREYFTLLTDTGLLVQIYHEAPAGAWRLQRVYD